MKCAEALSFYLDLSPTLSQEGAWIRMQRLAGSLLGDGVVGDLSVLVRGKLALERKEKKGNKIEPLNVFH